MGGASATQHAPKSLLELEDLLKDDIKVKVAGKRASQRWTGPIVLTAFVQALTVCLRVAHLCSPKLIPYVQSMGY